MTPNELFNAVVGILDEHQRPTEKLELVCNYKKGTDSLLTSARVQFKDSSYALAGISYARKKGQVNIRAEYKDVLQGRLLPFAVTSVKSDPVWLHVDITDPQDLSFLDDIICKSYDDSPSRESFGCCGLYKECSDALHCIHPDPPYAKACQYRKNLEAGRVFYGKNANV